MSGYFCGISIVMFYALILSSAVVLYKCSNKKR